MKLLTPDQIIGVMQPLTTEVPALAAHLVGFWAADEWDMAACPLLPAGTSVRHTYVQFDCSAVTLNTELKYACWRKFSDGSWSITGAPTAMSRVRYLIRFLKEAAPATRSLLERALPTWESMFQSYLETTGSWAVSEVQVLDQSQNIRKYQSRDARISTLREIYRVVQDAQDNRPEYEKDIWDVRRMGAVLSPAAASHTINFTRIPQHWLRQAAKQYLRYRLAVCAVSTCLWDLHAINRFAAFVSQRPRPVQPADLDRALITEYLGHLATQRPAAKSRQNELVHLRNFLEVCVREEWAAFPNQQLIYDEDLPRRPKSLPRPIPEEVLAQLQQHLSALPEPFRTMVLVLQECGMRISELRALALDCLVPDEEGDWFLRYYQWKMAKEHSIPITPELAAVIQEQQRIVRAQWGNECPILFPNAKGKPLGPYRFSQTLNQLAVDQDIRAATGQIFRFRAQAFRHTVGTRMLRNGVRQYHVQKYLGHESPEMTMAYAQITDQDLKKAFAAYQELAIDVTGKVMPEERQVGSADLAWFKKNILAQALPHGYCALPVLAGPCPYPNACLTCASFRTNASFLGVLQAELQATEDLLGIAQAHNWQRQIEMNERVKAHLHQIITSLEHKDHDSSQKC